jgi:hypothetical protein
MEHGSCVEYEGLAWQEEEIFGMLWVLTAIVSTTI